MTQSIEQLEKRLRSVPLVRYIESAARAAEADVTPECFTDPDDAMYGGGFCHTHGEVHPLIGSRRPGNISDELPRENGSQR